MSRAVTAILYAPGINCHEETAAALDLAGGRSELVLLRDLLDGRTRLSHYQAAVIPGGFSYGDHLGAGRIFGTILVAQLRDQLTEFLDAQKPLLGVCNGFQILAEAGILPGRTPSTSSTQATAPVSIAAIPPVQAPASAASPPDAGRCSGRSAPIPSSGLWPRAGSTGDDTRTGRIEWRCWRWWRPGRG